MPLFLFGLNHKTAPIEVRERIAFTEDACRQNLPALADGEFIREAFVLSTCNRVEFLVESPETNGNAIEKRIADFIDSVHQTTIETEHFYHFSEAEAVRHLFRVASSLDSMIVGETQILGQVRQSYKIAAETGAAKRNLHKLLHHAFHTAKRVRTETEIGGNAVSIASAAVGLARKTFGTLENKTVLIVGAGEMARSAAKHLCANGAKRILICNRTLENAVSLAMDCDAEVVPFEKLETVLTKADAVICSTSAQDFLITAENLKTAKIEEKESPTLFVDISVPRNVEPEIGKLKNVILADVDDLQTGINANLAKRKSEAERAETIIESEVAEFWQSLRLMNMGERLGLLREKMQNTARGEFKQNRSKLGNLTAEQEQAIEHLLVSTVNKLAHPILYGLRRSHEETGAEEFVEILTSLLDGKDEIRG